MCALGAASCLDRHAVLKRPLFELMLELTLERHGQQLQQPAELVLEPLGQQQMEMNLELEPRGQQLQQPVGLVFESLRQRVCWR